LEKGLPKVVVRGPVGREVLPKVAGRGPSLKLRRKWWYWLSGKGLPWVAVMWLLAGEELRAVAGR